MGNNESLPPLPPPGQPPTSPGPPAPPAGPPAYPPPPSYTPPTEQFPPTTQTPITQQLPPMQAFPGGPPGGFPPNGVTAFEQPAEPPKKKTWLIIAGVLVAVAAAVAGVLIVTRGDDKTVAPGTTPVTTIAETIPQITTPPEDTSVNTLPVITEPEVTQPATTDPSVTDPVSVGTIVSGGEIIDDLGVYSIVLPDGLAVDTTPITTKENVVLPSIAGAVDLQGFYGDDVTPGMYSVLAREDVHSTPAEVLAYLEPADGVCTGRDQIDAYPTALGKAILLKLDGCAGTASKVILVAAIEGSGSIVALYVQGPGASADLLSQAQTVFESVRLL